MKEVLKELSAPLTKEDVELRIGATSIKGFSLLLYKTARTDVKRLNSVCNTYWKNRHFYDTKELLCCEISIYDTGIKEWVSRVDVGTESYTEKEKGSYSDSFKRAGFRWGIGLELYQSPFIWISWEMELNKNGKGYKPKGFYPSSMLLEKYEVENGQINLKISYKSKGAIFTNIKKTQSKKNNDILDKISKAKTEKELISIYNDNEIDEFSKSALSKKRKELVKNTIPDFVV